MDNTGCDFWFVLIQEEEMKPEDRKTIFQVILVLFFLLAFSLGLLWLIPQITNYSAGSHEAGYIGLIIIYGLGGLIILMAKVLKIGKKK
jgi:flagellar biogenesis protein FliO